MITFDQVSLQYDAKHTALSNINIHIDKGSSFLSWALPAPVNRHLLKF